jgi:hypothetical protein
LAYKGKPRRRLTGAADLPDDELERPGRPWVPVANVGAMEAKDDVVSGGCQLIGGRGSGAQQSFYRTPSSPRSNWFLDCR